MIKVIDGKRYNTKTAEKVGEHWNGYSKSDFKYCSEYLYLTKSGTWFLHGEGGAMSKYSEPYGDMRGFGSEIIPLSPQEVMHWLERHDLVDSLEKYFGDQIKDA